MTLFHMNGGGSTEHNTDIVFVNGANHSVGKNRYLALEHLRLYTEDRVLWIDALYINQLDDRQKGHQGKLHGTNRNNGKELIMYQVAQMGKIYFGAAMVRVWFGLSDEHTKDTFAIIVRYYSEYPRGEIRSEYYSRIASLC